MTLRNSGRIMNDKAIMWWIYHKEMKHSFNVLMSLSLRLMAAGFSPVWPRTCFSGWLQPVLQATARALRWMTNTCVTRNVTILKPNLITSKQPSRFRFSIFCHANLTDHCYTSRELYKCRDHSVYGLSQWETTLQCNVVSHWLSSFLRLCVDWYWLIMMTSSNGNIFRVTGPLCGEFTGPG